MAGVSFLCFFLLGGRVIYICIHLTTFVTGALGRASRGAHIQTMQMIFWIDWRGGRGEPFIRSSPPSPLCARREFIHGLYRETKPTFCVGGGCVSLHVLYLRM